MEYRIADKTDIEESMNIRLEMLKIVNNLPETYIFDKEFIKETHNYLVNGNQTTIIASDKKAIGCATMCYIDIMPTFSHPTGKRAHLMNVYVNAEYRRKGIAEKMVSLLIEDAKGKGITEISLDATESGRPLYKKIGFEDSKECMTINLN